MEEDPLDVERLRLTPEMITEADAKRAQLKAAKQRLKAKPEAFVQLPYNERMLTAMGRRDASGAVAMELARLEFKTHTNPVLLPNAALLAAGVSRYAKARALRCLEEDG